MSTATSFTMTIAWGRWREHKYSSTGKSMSKMKYIHTVEYYSTVIRKNRKSELLTQNNNGFLNLYAEREARHQISCLHEICPHA